MKENNQNEKVSGGATITIGATMPLTGDSAEVGQATKAGLEMVLNELKQKNVSFRREREARGSK